MSFAKNFRQTVKDKLFKDEEGKPMPTYVTGDRFNGGMDVRLEPMKLKSKKDTHVVNKNINTEKSNKRIISNPSVTATTVEKSNPIETVKREIKKPIGTLEPQKETTQSVENKSGTRVIDYD